MDIFIVLIFIRLLTLSVEEKKRNWTIGERVRTKMEPGNNLPSVGNYPGGDRQQFCVSWNSHQSNMHSAFPKLLSSEQFVDVTLACDGGSIKCHKVVLSACSDYLERLLLDIPCTHPIIFLRDMRMWELQALVEFMYRGEVYVEQQQLAKLMQAAEVLQVRQPVSYILYTYLFSFFFNFI